MFSPFAKKNAFFFRDESGLVHLVLSWFSVNWNFMMFELIYSAKGELCEKETSQLHTR